MHSPTTVQTNVSPVQHNVVGLPPQAVQPLPSTISHHHHQLAYNNEADVHQQQSQQPRSFSRPSISATESPPVIVEAVPRDVVVIGDEYRTLSREDELRASINLKESSLI